MISVLRDSLFWLKQCIILISWKNLFLCEAFVSYLCWILNVYFFIRKYIKTKHHNASIKRRGICPNLSVFSMIYQTLNKWKMNEKIEQVKSYSQQKI